MSDQLKIIKHFNSNVETVYNAWTKPELFTKWMGPGAVTCVKFQSDLRIGGQYEIHMQTEEGIKIAYGEYKQIEPNSILSFSWSWEDSDVKDSLVTLTFSDSEGGTELTLEHTNLPTKEAADHHSMGWDGSMKKLKQFLNS